MQSLEKTKTTLSLGSVSNELPIFSILGNQLPEKMQTPEAKKTIAKTVFWLLLAASLVGLYLALPTLIQFAQMFTILILYGIAITVLLLLFPKIVNLLHRLGEIALLRADKAVTKKYSIETLQLLLRDVKSTEETVHERITQVQAVRENMVTEAEKQNDEATKSYERVGKLTTRAKATDAEALSITDDDSGRRELQRKAQQDRTNATLAKSEGDASSQLASSYAQYANGFSKALEVLKDNELAVKIYVSQLSSSITIAEKKMDATTKMRQATEGLADIFQVEDTARFQLAMDAVAFKISDDIAHVQRNLEFLSQSRIETLDAVKSQDELEAFVNKMSSGEIKKLDVQEVSSSYHKLTKEEKVDKGFDFNL